MNLVLVGFMGSGKTAVGRRIAARLGYGFLDMDQFIEQRVGCTIAELFERKGEAHFRALETELLEHLPGLSNHVISTGGGILTSPGNLERLRRIGVTLFLNADPGEILARLERDTRRPMLKGGELKERVDALLAERMPLYRQAELAFDTKGKSVNRVAGEIIHLLAEHGGSGAGNGEPATSPPTDPADSDAAPPSPGAKA